MCELYPTMLRTEMHLTYKSPGATIVISFFDGRSGLRWSNLKKLATWTNVWHYRYHCCSIILMRMCRMFSKFAILWLWPCCRCL